MNSSYQQTMTANRRLQNSGNINRCRCGRVILHVHTKKGSALRSSESDLSDIKNLCTECSRTSQQKNANISNELKRQHVSLLARLKVVKATNESTAGPLPREVLIIGNKCSASSTFEPYAESSDFGFDGISPTSTLDKRIPTRFTFDGVVPSKSFGDSDDIPEGERVSSDESETGSILNDLAESECSERSFCDRIESTENKSDYAQTKQVEVKGLRERSRTASTSEMSIEFSEADHHRTCAEEEKNSAFSPTRGNEEIATMIIGRNSALADKRENETSSSWGWFDFGFFAMV